MFVDSVRIFIQSGNGGAGAVSFRREKFVLQGGPDGGDGGRGGDVYFLVDKNTSTLAKFRGHKHYKAENGSQGGSRNCHGKKGKDVIINVPPGTQVIDANKKTLLLDLLYHGEKIKILNGGKGGLGNARFKNSINQRPTYAQKGLAGSSLEIILELKLIADVALVGFPNAGKSSLIARLTHSKPTIADYEFSTVIPHLGVVDINDFQSYIIADIPGLIRGASKGKGLGLQFLKHIERTKILLFLLDVSRFIELSPNENSLQDYIVEDFSSSCENTSQLIKQFIILFHELEQYSKTLSCKYYGIALSKSDTVLHETLGEQFAFTQQNLKILQTKAYIAPCLKHYIQEGFVLDSSHKKNLSKQDAASIDSHILHSVDSLQSQHKNAKNLQDSQLQNLPIKNRPLFILPLSSVSGLNLEGLRMILFYTLKYVDSINSPDS